MTKIVQIIKGLFIIFGKNYKRMQCEKPVEQFVVKRRELIEKHQRSRRDEIFNRTRKILAESDHLDTQPQENSGQEGRSTVNTTSNTGSQQHKCTQSNSSNHPSRNNNQTAKKKWQYYKNFQYPDWLIEIPSNLHEYYFSIRPTGQRVFIHLKKNKILIISLYGQVLKTINLFKFTLSGTLLQGYFLKEQNILIVSDLLVWKENPMSSSQFQFRLAWLMNNFMINSVEQMMSQNSVKLKIVEFWNLNKENFVAVYESIRKKKQDTDGLLFFHKDSFYLHEVNPMVLLWKDLITSPMLQSELVRKDLITSPMPQSEFQTNPQQSDSAYKHSITEEQTFCEKQLKNLSLKEKTTHFYAEFSHKEQVLYTFERIPLLKLNHNKDKKLSDSHSDCIIKFAFSQIRYKNHSSVHQILLQKKLQTHSILSMQSELIQDKNQQEFPYDFEGFQIISLHQLNTRIPDPFSKILWKHNFANNLIINYHAILNEIVNQQNQTESSTKTQMDIE